MSGYPIWILVLLGIQATIAGIPFALMQAMPGRRSFAALSLAYVGVIAGVWSWVSGKSGADASGAAFMAGLLMFGAGPGAVLGIVARAASLYMVPRKVSEGRRRSLTLALFLLIPAGSLAFLAAGHWAQRAPGRDCRHEVVGVLIAGTEFRSLSTLSYVTRELGSTPSNMVAFINFQDKRDLRYFCEQSANGTRVIQTSELQVELTQLEQAQTREPRLPALCRQAGWPEEVCAHGGSLAPTGYPDKVLVFEKGGRQYFWQPNIDYESVRAAVAKADNASDITGFAFDGREYLWADPDAGSGPGSGAGRETPPLALRCHPFRGGLACVAEHGVTDRIHVQYRMLVGMADPVSDARRIQKSTLEFVKILEHKR